MLIPDPAELVTLLNPSVALLCTFFAVSAAFSVVVEAFLRVTSWRDWRKSTREGVDIAIDIVDGIRCRYCREREVRRVVVMMSWIN